jgi:hypothetical protein
LDSVFSVSPWQLTWRFGSCLVSPLKMNIVTCKLYVLLIFWKPSYYQRNCVIRSSFWCEELTLLCVPYCLYHHYSIDINTLYLAPDLDFLGIQKENHHSTKEMLATRRDSRPSRKLWHSPCLLLHILQTFLKNQ